MVLCSYGLYRVWPTQIGVDDPRLGARCAKADEGAQARQQTRAAGGMRPALHRAAAGR